MTGGQWSKVDDMLKLATWCSSEGEDWKSNKDLVAPGMELLVSKRNRVLYHEAVGSRILEPEVDGLKKNLTFDIASLTKALVTSVLLMKLVERGRLELDKKLTHIFQTFGTLGKEKITVRNLLNHSSGYPAHVEFYKDILEANRGKRAGVLSSRGAVEFVYNSLFRSELEYETGTKSVYSDLGFMLLGKVIETTSGTNNLTKLAWKEIFSPLGLKGSGFVDLSALKHHRIEAVPELIVPTLNCPWRKKLLCGEVHDDNAWAMGGVCGHAGLFSTINDVHQIASELLRSYKGQVTLLDHR